MGAIVIEVDPSRPSTLSFHGLKPRADSAKKVSELLKDDHDRNHIFFTEEEKVGVYMHNHLVHHALTLYALGASPEIIDENHRRNQLYQRSAPGVKQAVIRNLDDPEVFKSMLGKDDQYTNFLQFFEQKIAAMGQSSVLEEFLFGRTEIANTLFCSMFSGFLHPLLEFGFAMEFQQVAVLAESLAQACGHHDDFLKPFLQGAEAKARSGDFHPSNLVDLIEEARSNTKICKSSNISFFRQFRADGTFFAAKDHIRDGVLANAGPEITSLAARWQVTEDELELKTAHLANAAAYVVCAAQRAPYECRFDFFTLHGLTTSLFHSTFLAENSITRTSKARLLEYLGRMIIALYAGEGCPAMDLPYALAHKPKIPGSTWESIVKRSWVHQDDSHMSKAIRALANAQRVSAPYDARPEFKLKQDMFLPLANAMIDSGSDQPMDAGNPLDWIRGCGFPEAWERVPRRDERR